jgi:hypothetical protein
MHGWTEEILINMFHFHSVAPTPQVKEVASSSLSVLSWSAPLSLPKYYKRHSSHTRGYVCTLQETCRMMAHAQHSSTQAATPYARDSHPE